ncbi:MAG: endonuclease [Deltaproteobacteria bacterium]|nr:endonuclease [Deltaproteobacteria bacterium]
MGGGGEDGGSDGGLTDGGSPYAAHPPIFFSAFGLSYLGPVADQGDTWVEVTVADPEGLAALEAAGGWSYKAANHRYVNHELSSTEFELPLEVGDVIRIHGATYPGGTDVQKTDNNPEVWDVTSVEPFGPSFKHGVLWLEAHDGTILDAVLYVTNMNQTDWLELDALAAAEAVVAQGQWPGSAEADALRIADVDRDWPRLRNPYAEGRDAGSWQIVGETLETYYERAMGLTGDALKAALNTIIRDHVIVPYSEASSVFHATDVDPADSSAVIQFYTGRSTTADFNKEHVWAKSHGGFGYDGWAGYSDLHALRPTRPDVNSVRWHLDFAAGGDLYSDTECRIVPDYSFEPPDFVKGDVARVLFYMAVRYEGDPDDHPMPDLELEEVIPSLLNAQGVPDNNQHMSTPRHGKLSEMLQWHLLDPPDAREVQRNEIIFRDYQRNRNPFVDHPEWVHEIWGGPLWTP